MTTIQERVNNNPTKLLNLETLPKKYGVDTLNVQYRYKQNETKYITIPLDVNLFIQLKTYILHDTRTDQLIVAKKLIGVKNYWITQLLDDHKNKRIDVTRYYV